MKRLLQTFYFIFQFNHYISIAAYTTNRTRYIKFALFHVRHKGAYDRLICCYIDLDCSIHPSVRQSVCLSCVCLCIFIFNLHVAIFQIFYPLISFGWWGNLLKRNWIGVFWRPILWYEKPRWDELIFRKHKPSYEKKALI